MTWQNDSKKVGLILLAIILSKLLVSTNLILSNYSLFVILLIGIVTGYMIRSVNEEQFYQDLQDVHFTKGHQ